MFQYPYFHIIGIYPVICLHVRMFVCRSVCLVVTHGYSGSDWSPVYSVSIYPFYRQQISVYGLVVTCSFTTIPVPARFLLNFYCCLLHTRGIFAFLLVSMIAWWRLPDSQDSNPGSLDLVPWLPAKDPWLSGFDSGALDLVPWLPSEGFWLPGFRSWLPGEGSWLPVLGSWCAGLGSMVARWRFLHAWIQFLVPSTWFHDCLVKAPGCLDSLHGSLDFITAVPCLPSEGFWLYNSVPCFLDSVPWCPGFGSWLPGFGFWFSGLGSMVSWTWSMVPWTRFSDCLMEVPGCRNSLPGSFWLVSMVVSKKKNWRSDVLKFFAPIRSHVNENEKKS